MILTFSLTSVVQIYIKKYLLKLFQLDLTFTTLRHYLLI